MSEPLRQLRRRLRTAVWDPSGTVPRWLRRPLRLAWVLTRDLVRGDLSLRAMSLVYATLLATVPLLAVSFSVLKAFGFHEQLTPLLDNFFSPLGSRGDEVVAAIVDHVERVNVSLLGSIGLALLIYTVVSLMQKVEAAFNFVWRVGALRSLPRRLSNYLSILLVGPAFLLGTVGLVTSMLRAEWVERLVLVGELARLLPYFLVWTTFLLVYVFVPNARVKPRPAAAGALAAGVAWQGLGWGFATFISTSAKYTAIYSSFVIPVLVLIWVYMNWLILLLGAQLAFYLQNPRYVTRETVHLRLSNRLKERLAVETLVLIGAHHYRNEPAWSDEELARRLDLPIGPIQEVLELLRGSGFIEATADVPARYLPARDLDTVTVEGLLRHVRSAEENRFVHPGRIPPMQPVDGLIDGAAEAAAEELRGTTLRDLVLDYVRSGPTGLADDDASRRAAGDKT